MLIYGSSQELDVVSKPNLRNQNDVDGLKANDWVKYVEPWMSILGGFHKFFSIIVKFTSMELMKCNT